MSIGLMKMVWHADISATDKSVLLKLADWANDEGDSIYPRKDTVAKLTGLSQSAVASVVRKYVAQGLLAVVEKGGGRGRPTRYCMNVGVLSALPKVDLDGEKPCTTKRVSGKNPAPQNPFLFEDERGFVTDGLEQNPAPGGDKPSTTKPVSEPIPLTDLSINDPSSSSDDEDGGRKNLARTVFDTMREVPACRNATKASPDQIEELIGEHPGLTEGDWIDFVRWCRDKYNAIVPRYGSPNTTWSETPAKLLRENIRAWKAKQIQTAQEESRPAVTAKPVVEDRETVFCDIEEADCMAFSPVRGKWFPAIAKTAQARGFKTRDIDDQDRADARQKEAAS